MHEKSGNLISPAQKGDKGTKGAGPSPSGGKFVSPSQKTNRSESSGHSNGGK